MDRLIRLPELTEITGLSRAELYRRSAQGKFPRARVLGPRSRGWLASEVQAWIESLEPAGPVRATPEGSGGR